MACTACGGQHDRHPRLPLKFKIRYGKRGPVEPLKMKYYVLDISTYQRKLDFAAIKAMGLVHAIVIRLTIGDTMDKRALHNIAECEKYNIPWMLYMGTTPGTNGTTAFWDPISEAQAYVDAVNLVGAKHDIYYLNTKCLHWMDIESGDEETAHDDMRLDNGLNKDQISLWNMTARDHIYRARYLDLGLYSYYSYMKHEMRYVFQPRWWLADYRGKQPQPIPPGYTTPPAMIQVGQANDPDFPGLGTIDGTHIKSDGSRGKIDVNYGTRALDDYIPAPCRQCGCPGYC